MDFRLTPEQTGFAQSLTELMTKADSVAAARAWAAGDHAPGQALWKRLADQGVTALVLPEDEGGLGGTPVDLVVAFEVLGHQLAVGPWIESAALAPQAEGEMVTAGVSPLNPYAVDADVATLLHGSVSDSLLSVDTTRRLFEVHDAQPFDEGAIDLAVLACSAELLGCGERLLADSVEYVQQRKQYGRVIGSYQAIKHQLADVRIALDFARPLVHGAAPRRAATTASASPREGRRRRRGVPLVPGSSAGARCDRLHRGVRPRALDQPGAGTGRGVGRLVVPPGADRGGSRLMHFARTEEQDELATIVASLLDKRSDSAAVRAAMESDAGYDESLWQAMCEQVGVAALPVPEEYDGFGASLVETAVVLEEVGRNLAPSPLLATAIATSALLLRGTDEQKSELLPRIAAGEVATLVTGAVVLDGAIAEIVLRRSETGLEVMDEPGIERVGSLDQTIGLGRLGDAGEIGVDPALRDIAWALTSSLQVGAAQRGLDMTVAYSKERVQFGRPDRVLPGTQAPDGRHARPGRGIPLRVVGSDRRCCGVRPGPDGATRRGLVAARRRGPLLLLRGPGRHRLGDRPAPRRHRHHLGARRPAGLQARPRAEPAVGAGSPCARVVAPLTLSRRCRARRRTARGGGREPTRSALPR